MILSLLDDVPQEASVWLQFVGGAVGGVSGGGEVVESNGAYRDDLKASKPIAEYLAEASFASLARRSATYSSVINSSFAMVISNVCGEKGGTRPEKSNYMRDSMLRGADVETVPAESWDLLRKVVNGRSGMTEKDRYRPYRIHRSAPAPRQALCWAR